MDQRIASAIEQIDAHLADPLDVRQLAASVNLSESRFAHLFRAETGVSPMRFVRERRMARARGLLEGTYLSVKDVMTTVGCNDPSHFARDFRRYHGTAPRHWRASCSSRQQ